MLTRPRLIKVGKLQVGSQFCYSDIAGHLSFSCLALGYLTTDIMELRIYAFSGISFAVVFQYYRATPLWLPIRWNVLFLLINAVMIAFIAKDEYDANNLSDEHKLLYKQSFESKGMKPVEYMKLMSVATRIEAKPGDKLVREGHSNERICLVKSGKVAILKGDHRVGTIVPYQYVGAMSFLNWEGKATFSSKIIDKKKEEKRAWDMNRGTGLFTTP